MVRQKRRPVWLAVMAAATLVVAASSARVDQWNDRTELTFTEPVMIPGATLQPGTYVFRLADTLGSRHVVRVSTKSDGKTIAVTQAIPIKRAETKSDTVLSFNPTEGGVPALKAWYYPNSRYGHEFIYPEEQARQIAERTKSIVLSVDVAGTDLEKGTLRLYHPSRTRSEWREDPAIKSEWEAWQRARAVVRTAEGANQRDDEDRNAVTPRAPMMVTDPAGMKVDLDELESNPSKYMNKRVIVDAEVEEVFGPRLFTIDEPHWGDLDGEVLVYAPSMLAALVRDDDRITITGTLKPVAMADIEREWGWFELDPDVEVEFLKKPVLVADRIVGGSNNVAMFIDTNAAGKTAEPSAKSGVATTTVMDPGMVGAGSLDLVGRWVDLKNVRVLRPAQGAGFFIDVPGGAVLVLPLPGVPANIAAGDTVSVYGAVADTPRRIAERVNPPAGWNNRIYIVATAVSK